MDVPDRTPVVTVELQLRPQPPKGSTPWFWGAGMLDFHSPRRKRGETVKVVWRAELPKALRDRSARVQYLKNFGWVLVVRFTHEDAEVILLGSLVGVWGCIHGEEAPFLMTPIYVQREEDQAPPV